MIVRRSALMAQHGRSGSFGLLFCPPFFAEPLLRLAWHRPHVLRLGPLRLVARVSRFGQLRIFAAGLTKNPPGLLRVLCLRRPASGVSIHVGSLRAQGWICQSPGMVERQLREVTGARPFLRALVRVRSRESQNAAICRLLYHLMLKHPTIGCATRLPGQAIAASELLGCCETRLVSSACAQGRRLDVVVQVLEKQLQRGGPEHFCYPIVRECFGFFPVCAPCLLLGFLCGLVFTYAEPRLLCATLPGSPGHSHEKLRRCPV